MSKVAAQRRPMTWIVYYKMSTGQLIYDEDGTEGNAGTGWRAYGRLLWWAALNDTEVVSVQ